MHLFAARLLVPTVLLAALAGCTRQPTPGLPDGASIEDLPDSESWDARLRTSDDGRRRLEIDAPYLARYTHDSAYVYLGPGSDGASSRVAVRVFDADGDISASVAASEAWYYEADGRLVAQGDVQTTVSGSGGANLQADRVTLVDRTVEAAGGVRATVRGGDGAEIEASQLRLSEGGAFAASGGTVVRLTGGAQAVVRARRVAGRAGGRVEAEGNASVDASGGRTLRAGRVVWDEGAGRFRAPGAFSFTGPGERVRGVGLTANRDLTRYSFRDIRGEIEVRE